LRQDVGDQPARSLITPDPGLSAQPRSQSESEARLERAGPFCSGACARVSTALIRGIQTPPEKIFSNDFSGLTWKQVWDKSELIPHPRKLADNAAHEHSGRARNERARDRP